MIIILILTAALVIGLAMTIGLITIEVTTNEAYCKKKEELYSSFFFIFSSIKNFTIMFR